MRGSLSLDQIVECFHQCFEEEYHTRLQGGFDEPYYQASRGDEPARIQFREDFPRSALHEVSHWCVAGATRRLQDDFGYWYAPDGRSKEQQLEFFRVEVRPQAFEWIFCDAAGLDFEVSLDNLNGDLNGLKEEEIAFKRAVLDEKEHILNSIVPQRVHIFAKALAFTLQNC